jgi:hypothetical protein
VAEERTERAESPARARLLSPESMLARPSPLDWLVGGITVVLYVIGQLVFLEGPHPYDPARYFRIALDFPDVPATLFTMRVGLVAPVRAAILVFGPSEAALYAVPIVSGVVLVGAVFATMLVLFRDRALAAAAALLTGLNVHYLVNSSHIFPDVLVTALFTAAVFCLLLAGLHLQRRRSGGGGVLPTILILVGGILLGWSYLAREFSPILLPVVVALLIAFRYPLRQIAVLAVGALAVFMLEPVAGRLVWDRPLIHWRLLLKRDETVDPDKLRRMEFVQDQLDRVPDTLLVFPRLLLAFSSGWAFLVLTAVFLIALVLLCDRRLWLFFIWFASVFVTMTAFGLGSLSSGAWILNITNIRYWYPILPPLVMGALGGLWLLLRAWFPGPRGAYVARGAALCVAAAVLVPGFVEFSSCSAKYPWKAEPAEPWHEVRSWFLTPQAAQFDSVHTDLTTWRLLPAYAASTIGRASWRGDVETLEPAGGFAPTSGLETSLLLVNKDRWRTSAEVEAQWQELSEEWAPVFVSGDGDIVLLAHESALDGEPPATREEWWGRFSAVAEPVSPGTCGVSPYERPD